MLRNTASCLALLAAASMLAPLASAVSFKTPVPLNSNSASDSGDDAKPVVVTDKLGHWVTVWQSNDTLGDTIGSDFDILVSLSNDNGATWSAPEALNSNAAADAGDDKEPVLTTDSAGHWVCVWQSTTALGMTDGADTDLFVSTSNDNGATWSDVEALNTTYESDGSVVDTSPSVATDDAGVWVCAWESDNSLGDTIGADLDILVSRSTDNGATWSTPAPAKATAGTDGAATDEKPCIIGCAFDRFIIAWQTNDTLGGFYDGAGDIIHAYSENHGVTWIGPLGLSNNPNLINNGPDENVSLATDGNGTVLALWDGYRTFNATQTDRDIFVAYSQNNGIGFSWYADLSPDTAAGFKDENPVAVTDGKSTWLAMWERTSDQGGSTDVDFMKSESFALSSFFVQLSVNDNTATDDGDDKNLSAATDSNGHWVLAWDSNEDLSKPLSADRDIAYSTRKPGTKDDLIVIRPDGSRSFKIGKKVPIRWSSSYDAGPYVKIEVLKGNSVIGVISESLRNRNRKGWRIPGFIVPDDDYRIRVRAALYPEIKSTSKKFEIKPAK
ncbi:MAG: exo-alpha-sialidase [Candidatus Hydrogenedentes bacterium]|nr:exo-alpha-sialidase [Candidatus Hydrogenedentota bacterium]